MRLGACVCGANIHWHTTARSRRGWHIGALVVTWGPLGVDDEELLGPSHVVDWVAEIKVCISGDCQNRFLRRTPMKAEVSGGAYASLGTRQGDRRFWGRWLKCMCFALMNTSFQISEGRVLTFSSRAEGQWRDQRDWGDGGVRRKYSMRYSNWGVAPSACRGYILQQRVRRIIWKEQEGNRGNYRGQGEWQRIVEWNRIKLLMTDQWCHHKRLTIIRTKAGVT